MMGIDTQWKPTQKNRLQMGCWKNDTGNGVYVFDLYPLYTTSTILPSDHLFHPTKHHPIHPIILEKTGTAADINRPHLTHKSILPVFFTHFPNNSSTRSLFFFHTFH